MAKTVKKKTVKKPTRQMVWQIYDFRNTYEFPMKGDTFKKGPVDYVKLFVKNKDQTSIRVTGQLDSLLLSENGLMAMGLFFRMLRKSANQSRCYRGYLLDDLHRPATNKTFGEWANNMQSSAVIKKLIKLLDARDLIEKVELPDFDPSEDDTPETPPETPDKPNDDAAKPGGKKGGKKATKSKKSKKKTTAKNTNSKKARKIPENSGKIRTPLNKTASGKQQTAKPKVKTASGKRKTQKGEKTASEKPRPKKKKEAGAEKENPNDEWVRPDLKLHTQTQAESTAETEAEAEAEKQPESTGQTGTSAAPPATPKEPKPNEPTRSDAGVGQSTEAMSQNALPRSVNPITDRLEAFYDPTCMKFATEIYVKLKVPYLPDTKDARRELGAIATAWSRAQNAGLPPSVLAELWDKSVKEAGQIGLKRKRVRFSKSPEAVWMWQFNRRLAARGRAAAVG